MSKSIVITLVGDDRPGIVEQLSRIVVAHNGDWVESRMANLGGKFAGVLRVELPDESLDGLRAELQQGIAGIILTLETIEQASSRNAGEIYKIQLIGHNQPGIVHRISSAIAACGASVDDMESEVTDASMSGEKLFKASIELHLPADHDADELRYRLEALANEMIVDIEVG